MHLSFTFWAFKIPTEFTVWFTKLFNLIFPGLHNCVKLDVHLNILLNQKILQGQKLDWKQKISKPAKWHKWFYFIGKLSNSFKFFKNNWFT